MFTSADTIEVAGKTLKFDKVSWVRCAIETLPYFAVRVGEGCDVCKSRYVSETGHSVQVSTKQAPRC